MAFEMENLRTTKVRFKKGIAKDEVFEPQMSSCFGIVMEL
jgi:hypothetical protein